MRFIPQSAFSLIRPLIVCCVHGDERFGLVVFDRLLADAVRRPRVSLLLANEPAIRQNVRFFESDLNRSFPGDANRSSEERLAGEILPYLREATHVLDIHTTTSEILLLPIVTCLEPPVQRILAHTTTREIAFIDPPKGVHSLIGQTGCGVSLEFGHTYADSEAAYQDILRVIDGLLDPLPSTPKERRVFHINGFIPNTVPLPKDARNFQYIPELNCYPVLLHEKAYTGSHAMKATSAESRIL